MTHSRAHTDDGFSLVEVVIAMFLVGVLALAVLPLMIGATKLSVTNRNLVEANAFAAAKLAPIRDAFPVNPSTPTSCAALRTRVATGVTDPAHAGLTADIAVGACPGTYPGTVSVSVKVTRDGDTLVTLPTRVLVGGA